MSNFTVSEFRARQSHHSRKSPWALFAILAALIFGVAGVDADIGAGGVNLLGRSRAEVEAVLGRPNSSLRRGDGEVLVFGEGVRVEMRGDRVVSVRGGSFGEIVVGDGARFTVDEQGKATFDDRPALIAPDTVNEQATRDVVVESAIPSAASAAVEAVVVQEPEVVDEDLALVHSAQHPEEELASSNPAIARMLEAHDLELEGTDETAGPDWVGNLVEIVVHLIVVLVILALSLKWLDLPFIWSDLAKVGLLTVAVREALHGIGGLGGNWEMLRLFRIDKLVSFIALAVLLFRFKVVLTGLTALKVAAATKFVAYMLMIGVGLALTFGMLAVQ